MMSLFILSSAVLGLLVGSFLNVVALRYNTGRGLGGRSFCFSCGHCLSWYELIPVVSWIWQKGRCRSCSSKVSHQYALGELLAGLVFAAIAGRSLFVGVNDLSSAYIIGTLFLMIISSVLIVISHYDLRHKIIPDALSIIFALLALLSTFFFGLDVGVFTFVGAHLPSLMQLLAGVLVPLPFALLWLISSGRWIGLGDPKLMVGIGLLLGVRQGFTSVILSFWLGAAFVIIYYLVQKLLGKKLSQGSKESIMKLEVPFAPFLILGLWCSLLVNLNFFLW